MKAVKIGSRWHLKLISAGYRTHHTDGAIAFLESPNIIVECPHCDERYTSGDLHLCRDTQERDSE